MLAANRRGLRRGISHGQGRFRPLPYVLVRKVIQRITTTVIVSISLNMSYPDEESICRLHRSPAIFNQRLKSLCARRKGDQFRHHICGIDHSKADEALLSGKALAVICCKETGRFGCGAQSILCGRSRTLWPLASDQRWLMDAVFQVPV